MADNNKLIYAREAYDGLCKSLDSIGWKYQRMDDELKIMFGVNGDDLPMTFLAIVDADRQLVRLISLLPFKMNKDKMVEGAVSVCAINYLLADGSFDLDLEEGNILFKLTSSFRNSLLGEETFKYMVAVACHTIDLYNDKLFDLSEGRLSMGDLLDGVAGK